MYKSKNIYTNIEAKGHSLKYWPYPATKSE